MSNIGIFQRTIYNKPIWSIRDWITFVNVLYLDVTQDDLLLTIKNRLGYENRQPNRSEIVTIINLLKSIYEANDISINYLEQLLREHITSSLKNLNIVVQEIINNNITDNSTDLVLGDSVVTMTGAETQSGGNNGHFLWSPRGLWYEGKTYIPYPRYHGDQGLGQLYIIVYDENNGIIPPLRFGNTQILNQQFFVADNHITPVFQIDNNGRLGGFQERPHDSPIDIYIADNPGAFNNFQLIPEKINPGVGIGAESSYHNLIKLSDGNFFSLCRMTILYEAYSGGHGASIKSSNGLEGWGSLIRHTTNPRPVTTSPTGNTDTRHYTIVPYYRQIVGDYIYSLTVQRVDNHSTGLGLWHKFHAQRTPLGANCGILFENLLGTPYTHDVSGNNYRTEAILDSNFMFYNSGSHLNNAFNPICVINLALKFFIVRGSANTGLLVLDIIDVPTRTITSKFLNIPGYHFYDPTIYQIMAVKHIAYIEEGQYLELGVEIDHVGGLIKSHIFRSYDLGNTFIDQGDIFPELSVNTFDPTFPFNYYEIPRGRNFVITCLTDDSANTFGTKVTHFKRAVKGGRIKPEVPVIIFPATNFSDANDFFHYECDDGKMVRSGNSIISLTDQFGLRDATGISNPQWNGIDEVTVGGANYFTIPTAGFSGLTKCTFFVVARRTSATAPGILFISNNLVAGDYIGWFLNDGGAGNTPSFRFSQTGQTTLIDHGQYVPAIDELVLLSFQIDGRCKTDIGVNGNKQIYQTSGYSTLTHFQKRGTMNYGTINAVNIGRRDISGTDLIFPFSFKTLLMKNTIYDYYTHQSLQKKVAEKYGMSLNYGYR